MQVIGLGVVARPDGGWDLVVGRAGIEPTVGSVDPATVAAVHEATRPLLAANMSWTDQAWRTHEARAARALATALDRSGAPAADWVRAIGRAESLAEPVAVLLDVPAALRALPWELLGVSPDAPPLESLGLGCVVRLSSGVARPREPRGAAEVVVTRLGNDPVLACVHEAISVACHHGGTTLPRSGPTSPHSPRVVSVLVAEDRAGLLDGGRATQDGERDPEDDELAAADLVWLAVCGEAARPGGIAGARACRLLRAGAPAVLEADTPLDVEAAAALARGLHESLLRGADLLGATLAARASVREHRVASPGGRWWRARLWASGPASLQLRPWAERTSAVRAWPEPAPCAAELLARAGVYAELAGHLGVEQLAEGLLDHAPPGLAALRERVLAHRAAFTRAPEGLSARSLGGPPAATPRLHRLVRALPHGYTARAILEAVAGEAWAWGRWLGDTPAHGTRPVPAGAFEVLGGPEDGLRLVLDAGEVIGRASTRRPCDAALYARTTSSDGRLSRRHLRWLGEGWVHLLAPASALHQRAARREAVLGQVEVFVGDLIELTPATWIVAVDVPTAPRQEALAR